MANRGAVLVTGNKEIDRKLAKLPGKVQRRLGSKLLKGLVKYLVLQEAKNRVPVDTGELDDSLKVRSKRKRNAITYEVVAGTKQQDKEGKFYYAWFQEYGTKNHEATPFLRPAGYGAREEIEAIMESQIENELRKMGKLK